ncbi:hypothetical protein [uncultured Aquimarina sp.]|uniref:hypothetical protein n=1 Tax=uncultured Aquimarina sp. TaxID=575652 RepID=UPI0026366FCD|nr:hypothetical protein [uncultured Aquimarina sp.]
MKKKLRVNKSTILYSLRLICRYFVALMMFSYASAKIWGTQFSSDLSIGESTVDSLNGFRLTWYFYGFSKTYGMLIAAAQIIAAILLLFRKTVRMGTVLLLSFMVNILMLDIFYGIDAATPMAMLLTAMGIFLLLSDWRAFKAYFLKEELEVNAYKEELPKKLTRIHWFKYILIPIMFLTMFFGIYALKENFMKKNEFFGEWKVEHSWSTHKIDKIYFELNDKLVVVDTLGNVYRGKINKEENEINLKATHYSKSLNNFIKRNTKATKSKEERMRLTKLFHEYNNTERFKMNLTYQFIEDTLYIKNKDMKLKLVKVD